METEMHKSNSSS